MDLICSYTLLSSPISPILSKLFLIMIQWFLWILSVLSCRKYFLWILSLVSYGSYLLLCILCFKISSYCFVAAPRVPQLPPGSPSFSQLPPGSPSFSQLPPGCHSRSHCILVQPMDPYEAVPVTVSQETIRSNPLSIGLLVNFCLGRDRTGWEIIGSWKNQNFSIFFL